MKIGSLVENIEQLVNYHQETHPCVCPIKGKIYTVRDIQVFGSKGAGVLLEEIINMPLDLEEGIQEPYYPIRAFVELQPPMQISISMFEDSPKLLTL